MTWDANYEVNQIGEKLVGATIIGAAIDDSDADDFFGTYFGLRVRYPDGRQGVVWVMGDQEGNHCGALDIEEPEPVPVVDGSNYAKGTP